MFTSLLRIADRSDNVDDFLVQSHNLPIEGPAGEVEEVEQ